MADNKYERAMKILENERDSEFQRAKEECELIKMTKNPFKRMRMRKIMNHFLMHGTAIEIAIHAIKSELES